MSAARDLEAVLLEHVRDLREVLAGLMPDGHLSSCWARQGVHQCSARCARARAVFEKTEPAR